MKDIGFDVVGQLPSLRRYARALTRDGLDAEDLVHDALVQAYAGRSGFRGGNLRGWLLSIVHNTFVNNARRRNASRQREREAAEAAPGYAPQNQDHAARLAQLQDAFGVLPEEQRAALHLVVIEGLSYQEAATALGIPLGTLMSRIGRARAALRGFEEGAGEGTRTPRLRLIRGSAGGFGDTEL